MSYLNANAPYAPRLSGRAHAAGVALMVLAAGELFAFWLLCVHQVRMAETRRDEAAVELTSLADCLEFIPGSTIATCNMTLRPGARVPSPPVHAAAARTGAMPVSFDPR